MENWYITIHANILIRADISNTTKILYGLISNIEQIDGQCKASNKYFAIYLDITQNQVSTLITKLIEVELVVRKIMYNDKRQVICRILNTTEYLLRKKETPSPRKSQKPIVKKPKENNNKNNNSDSVSKIVI